MKKVIDGKLYDTEKAMRLGYWSNSYSRGDFNFCEESLYITNKSNYFIYGSGGALSKYSVCLGHNCTGGEQIEPVSEDAAKQWAEEHLSGEEYLDIFVVEEA